MKKRVVGLCLIMILVLSLCFSTALPVSADPGDNKPVAWVSWGGSNANSKTDIGYHSVMSVEVKQLSDGSTVGQASAEYFYFTVGVRVKLNFDVIDSHFEEVNGVKVAHILTLLPDNNFYFWWKLIDGGEPGNQNDSFVTYIWSYLTPGGPPAEPPVWPPVFQVPPIPPAWWPFFQGVPLPPDTLFPIVAGNIQVHITDDYVP